MVADRASSRSQGSGEERGVARLLAGTVPGLVAELSAARSARLYREALVGGPRAARRPTGGEPVPLA